jgi:NADH-quinone oxidoreductase subunit L
MSTELITWLLPLPPLLVFFFIVLFTNRHKALSHSIAVGAVLLSWLGSMIVFFRAIQTEHLRLNPYTSSINWIPTGDTWLKIGIWVDPLTLPLHRRGSPIGSVPTLGCKAMGDLTLHGFFIFRP